MNCPDCDESFPSESILHRHRVFEHAEKLEQETAERARALEPEDGRFTDDGFLKASNRRPERPPIFPAFGTLSDEMPPWERERIRCPDF